MRSISLALLLFLLLSNCAVLSQDIPKVHRNLQKDENGQLYFMIGDKRIDDTGSGYYYSIDDMKGSPVGTQTGIAFDFADTTFTGKLYYGFIPEGDSKHAHPVYFRSAED